MYNLTSLASNATGILGFVQGVNDILMLGWLGIMLLIGLTTIIFIAFVQTTGDASKSISATAFIAFGLAIFLKMISLIPNLALYITLIVAAVSIAFSWKR